MLTLFELFGAVFLYLMWERCSHTSYFSTTSLSFFQLHVHSVIPCLRPLPTEPS